MKHLLKISDLTTDEFEGLLKLAQKLKAEIKAGVEHHLLKGKSLGMIFSKSSTRTRVSFEVGMYQLGGKSLFLSSSDIQLGRGETVYDTAKVLSRYLDGIMIRTFLQSDVEDLAKYGSIPVINGLTDDHHPCQALADLFAIYEHKGKLKGLKLAYVGDGNNVAHSLMEACAKAGVDFAVASPKGYSCREDIVEGAIQQAKKTGCKIVVTEDPVEAVSGADAIYTDTWVSMGQESEKQERIKVFMPYQVNKKLYSHANDGAIFLHCLPAYRGYEMTEDIIDAPFSVVFDEAENRLHVQKAVMATLMG
ncbi:MAG: Ornithine carbamoyltransferase [Firmicutes bacterium ADurb.Bin193]|nr:MAG: Ornithine carbamoyltransferase [Firmicutes bacterium ADurb.Bin193]